MRVGIDSYCLNPLKLDPVSILRWVSDRGGEGVQFSEVHPRDGRPVDEGLLREISSAASASDMYLEWGGGEHVPFDTSSWQKKDLTEGNLRAAKQASALGATVVRSCSGGFFRWSNEPPDTETLLAEMAKTLRPQRDAFEDLAVTLAIELHFEFTTFELLRLFESCDAEPGGWLGVCLDTFNMLPMLEDPVAGTARVLPWVVATHMKDGAVSLGPEGLVTFPTELGHGQVDMDAIVRLLESAPQQVNLSVEDHGGTFKTNIYDAEFMTRFPDLTGSEMGQLIKLAHDGTDLLSEARVRATDRADWPPVCQQRTEAGVGFLKRLAENQSQRSD